MREQDALLRALVLAKAERAQVAPLREPTPFPIIEDFGGATTTTIPLLLLLGREGIKLL